VLYRLASDHWTVSDWSRSAFATLPLYRMGAVFASAGAKIALDHPAFASHPSAIRATLDPTMPALPLARPGLTPADVMDLRISARSRIPDLVASTQIAPCVRYNSSMDAYELHSQGNVLCWSARGEVILALLRAERFEPGYIGRALDPAYTIEEAAADADERERSRRARAASAAQLRAQALAAEEAAAALRRRQGPQDCPPDLSIDDLFSTL